MLIGNAIQRRVEILQATTLVSSSMSKKDRKNFIRNAIFAEEKLSDLDYRSRSFPLKQYLMFCNICDLVATSSYLNNWITFCIVLAGILVGLQTYPQLEKLDWVIYMDTIVLYSFTSEVVLKIFGEGTSPVKYFIGREWAWNIFDFLIVIFSLPILPVSGGSVKLLRLIRLMRLAKVFRKIPKLQLIIMGIIGGFKSVTYIIVLMLLIFYLFSVAGIIFFYKNDQFHFHSVEVAMLTMLRIATLDGWGDIFYINYYGCDIYNGGYYTTNPAMIDPNTGGIGLCTPEANPIIGVIFFLLYIVLVPFCVLSLFIGAITSSMADSMFAMRIDDNKKKDHLEKLEAMNVVEKFKDRKKLNMSTLRLLDLTSKAFKGVSIEDSKNYVALTPSSPLIATYKRLSTYALLLVMNKYFQSYIIFVIICAGVSVGMSTDIVMSTNYQIQLNLADNLIQYSFLFECVLKIIAEDVRPWRYFNDYWNTFDFVVVAGAFAPTGSGSLITILRLLRLLRVLKLMKAFKQLQVIVFALLDGAESVFFISLILFMFYYFFAVIGVTYFGENDPVHFGTVHIALLYLFNASTLDNWTLLLYINLYGCEHYGYASYPEVCGNSSGLDLFIFTSIYFVIFIIIGSLVLLSLFIGVVSMSMEQAKADQKGQAAILKQAKLIAKVENIDTFTFDLYREVFDFIDLTKEGALGRQEIKLALKLSDLELDEADFKDMWHRVDKDGSNSIDFSEFLEFMFDLRSQLNNAALGSSSAHKRRQFTQFGLSSTSEPRSLEGDDETSVNNIEHIIDNQQQQQILSSKFNTAKINKESKNELEMTPNVSLKVKPITIPDESTSESKSLLSYQQFSIQEIDNPKLKEDKQNDESQYKPISEGMILSPSTMGSPDIFTPHVVIHNPYLSISTSPHTVEEILSKPPSSDSPVHHEELIKYYEALIVSKTIVKKVKREKGSSQQNSPQKPSPSPAKKKIKSQIVSI